MGRAVVGSAPFLCSCLLVSPCIFQKRYCCFFSRFGSSLHLRICVARRFSLTLAR
ncbi:hypothetical protein EJ06DRAFT_529269 [Trichodelitschia bisporula]|uniref:Uncharacterized protein n=1 Tax=Trichodelitschia bisporula TaxID=703511 RepID=A0A6G1HYX0_9PEZI|nr:hypothetical protein EJ06DRAFT_529269 [Trichodelitschia bisporula]